MAKEEQSAGESPPEALESEGRQESTHGVGALLKASRLRCGEDLRYVSEMLHIRYLYLEAIEDDRFQDLPGPTYVTGFIRAYADHLGLDSDEVVRRLKVETSGSTGRLELDFPVPIPESVVPGGAILLVGVVLAILAYGGWYISSSNNIHVGKLSTPLPDRFLKFLAKDKPALPDSKDIGTTASAASAASAAAQADKTTPMKEVGKKAGGKTALVPSSNSPSTVLQSKPVLPKKQDAPKPDVSAVPDVPAVNAPGLGKVGQTAPNDVPDAVATTGSTKAIIKDKAGKTKSKINDKANSKITDGNPSGTANPPSSKAGPSKGTAVVAKVVAAGKKPVAAVPSSKPRVPSSKPHVNIVGDSASLPSKSSGGGSSSTPNKAPDIAASNIPTGRTYGLENNGSRITVRARADSWIQVRDDIADQLLLTRLLRRGDSYRVPNRPGLKLLTGNAGALDILIDGKLVPSIGATGVVRRGVALDVDRLRQGTAVIK